MDQPVNAVEVHFMVDWQQQAEGHEPDGVLGEGCPRPPAIGVAPQSRTSGRPDWQAGAEGAMMCRCSGSNMNTSLGLSDGHLPLYLKALLPSPDIEPQFRPRKTAAPKHVADEKVGDPAGR
jgi:hypothetical protein